MAHTTFTKMPLSGSTDGKRIKVAATADPGTVIHTGPTDPTSIDELWLDAYNSHTSSVTLTIEWGGNGNPDDLIPFVLAAGERRTLDPNCFGGIIKGNATPLVVKAYASVTNVVTIGGPVTRASA